FPPTLRRLECARRERMRQISGPLADRPARGAGSRAAGVLRRPAGARGWSAGRQIMAIDKRVQSAAQARRDVADGARVFITGFGGAGFPNVLIRALRDSGRKQLTLIVNSATHRYSLTHELIEAGLVRKVVCSAARGQGKDLSPFEMLWKA